MKFKIHWGWAIAIFYSSFVILYLIFVIKSKDVDHSLVFDDYYAEDIAYQKHYDRVANAKALKQDLVIKKNASNSSVEFHFPDVFKHIAGVVWFYKPNNEKLDFKKKVDVNSQNVFVVSADILGSGMWKVKVDWEGDGKTFYQEQTLEF